MHYEIEFNNSHLNNIFEAVRREIATPFEMLTGVGEALLTANNKRHLAGLDPNGKAWKALAASTLKKKRKGGILYSSGDMLNSIDFQVDSDTLRIGFDEPANRHLSILHHFGTAPHLIAPLNKKALKFGGGFAKKVNHPGLPARPLLGLPVSDQQLVTHVLEDHLTAVIRRAGV